MADRFVHHLGRAGCLDVDNVDTDQIIPSREMRAVSRAGLGAGLFAGWRYTDPVARTPDLDFVLNRPGQAGTSILVSGGNFGCGSSREHAVWALAEYGIRAIVAKSFGEIFHANCFQNGLLPITLPAEDVDILLASAGGKMLDVDLPSQVIALPDLGDWSRRFEINPFDKRMLLEGLDPIALTLKRKDEINQFTAADAAHRPWLYA